VNGDFRVGPWLVQPSLNTVSQNGTSIRLEPKVMEVLVCLAEHNREVVPKEKLLQTVWPDTFVTDDVLKRSVSELRRVFKDDAHESQIIETIPKRGYRLLVPVERVNGSIGKIASSAEPEVVSANTRGRGLARRWKLVAVCIFVTLLLLSLPFVSNLGGVRDWLRGNRVPVIRSVAVLPLQSLSDDPKQEYFAEGVTDALITDLAQISALRIVSRTTVMGYGRPNKPLPQIARELDVDGIVEGTVQRSGDRVRITAQLIYGPADRHLWANSFEREVKDVLELQNTVASEIANQIQARVTPEEKIRLLNVRRVNPKALDAYLEARFHFDQARKVEYYKGKRQQENNEFRKAVSYLDTAIQDDPTYIPAFVAYLDAVESFYEHLEYVPKTETALTKALELDPTNVPARLALARLLMQFEYDWAGAEREYKKAIELSFNSADAHFQYSEYLENVGRNNEADEQRNLAQSLDPANDYSWTCCDEAHIVRRGMTVDEEAAAVEQKAPDDPFLQGLLGKDYAIQSRYRESVEHWERCLTTLGWDNFVSVLRWANAKTGPKFALQEFMGAAEEYSRTHNDLNVMPMAFTYSSLGDKDRAFACLDKAVEQRSWIIIYLKRDNVWDPLRSDPRFKDLLRRVGLPV
jgi:TolB-like protein/DNA-binding winged helix-turn-helix (wHTH) protein